MDFNISDIGYVILEVVLGAAALYFYSSRK